jgi:hypothetical protein
MSSLLLFKILAGMSTSVAGWWCLLDMELEWSSWHMRLSRCRSVCGCLPDQVVWHCPRPLPLCVSVNIAWWLARGICLNM